MYIIAVECCDKADALLLQPRIRAYLEDLEDGDWCDRVVGIRELAEDEGIR